MTMSMRIRNAIFSMPEGRLFTSNALLSCGSRTAVDQNLHRLAKQGIIIRVARGVFMRETADRRRPSAQEVAIAKASAFGKQIAVSQANGKDSNSTTFLCSGGSSSFQFGNMRIRFKHSTKDLAVMKKIESIVLIDSPAKNTISCLPELDETKQPAPNQQTEEEVREKSRLNEEFLPSPALIQTAT